jgi:hypothetical protein
MKSKGQKLGSEGVKVVYVDGVKVEVVGCWDEETDEGKYDYYDFFVDGECVNLGSPYYGGLRGAGLAKAIRACLKDRPTI